MENQQTGNNNIPIAIVVAGLLVAGGLYFGMGKSTDTTNNGSDSSNTNVDVIPTVAPQNAQVSIDGQPTIGSADAPVTIVEFTDFECPYCKNYVDATYSKIKEEYIDTGLVKYVVRDFPLSFHDPKATDEAVAALCVYELKGDDAYFVMHDELFSNTGSNGIGVPEEDMISIAVGLGISEAAFKNCIADGTKVDIVKADLQDGISAGVTGTPSFFIGYSTEDNTIDGQPVVGAIPYNSFKEVIDEYLAK